MMHEARNQRIVKSYKRAYSLRVVAREFDLSVERIRQILNAVQPGLVRKQSQALTNDQRRERGLPEVYKGGGRKKGKLREITIRAAKLVEDGMTYGEASKELGISRNAVAGAVFRGKRRKQGEAA